MEEKFKKFLEKIKANPNIIVFPLIVLSVTIAILSLLLIFNIWTNDDKKPVDDNQNSEELADKFKKSGEYTMVYMSQSDVIEMYSLNVLKVLGSYSDEFIIDLFDKNFIKTFKNQDIFLSSIKSRGLVGKLLQFKSYSMSKYEDKKIYEVEVATADERYKDNIILVEYSPNNYKLSLDGYIGTNNEEKKYVNEGLELKIGVIDEYVSRYVITGSLTNKLTKDIVINGNGNLESVYLKMNNDQIITLDSSWLSGSILNLSPNMTSNFKLEFIIPKLQIGNIKSIVFENVFDENSKEEKDIEFKL